MDAPLEQAGAFVRQEAAGGNIFVFSYHIGSTYPLVNYARVQSASRFPQLWILAAEYMDRLHAPGPLVYRRYSEMTPAERYLNEAVLEDLERGRPRLLLVLRNARDHPTNGYRRIEMGSAGVGLMMVVRRDPAGACEKDGGVDPRRRSPGRSRALRSRSRPDLGNSPRREARR